MTTTPTVRARRAPAAPARTLRAFTLVELLVVIGVIGLLIGLLLPALGKVVERARATTTTGTMQEFAKACDAYFQEFGEYPGAIPDEYLYAGNTPTTEPKVPVISGTGNALLALMGGSRVPSDLDYAQYTGTVVTLQATGLPDFVIKIDPTRMGEGPMRNGKKYDPFFAPKGKEFSLTSGRAAPTTGTDPKLPDLVDAWGQPIIFIKQQRAMGALVPNGTDPGQFNRAGMLPYTLSTGLGELSKDQTSANNPTAYSLFNTTSVAVATTQTAARNLTLGQLIRHAALNVQNGSANDADKVYAGTARGRYFLFSAGADGVYFSVAQGYGTNSAPKTDIVSLGQNPDGPNVAARFDDLIVTGGS